MGRGVDTDWRTLRLRHLARVNPGIAMAGLAIDREVTFLPLACVWPDSRLDTSRTRLVGEVGSGYTRFAEGDVLIPKITPTFEAARSAIALGLLEGGPGFGTTELHVVRVGPELDRRFLAYRTLAADFLGAGTAAMVGVAGQRRVPVGFIKDFRVALPPLPEQAGIADFLDTETARIDELSSLTRRLILLLGQRLRTTMRAAIEDLPRDARLSYIATWRSGGTPPKEEPEHWTGELPWASSKDLGVDELLDTIDHITDQAAAEHSRIVPPGSLLISTRGMSLAKRLPLAVARRRMAFNQDLKALVPISGVDVDFLRLVLRGYESEVLAGVVESAHGTRRLQTRHLKMLRVPLPELRVQRQISERVRGVEEQIGTEISRLERRLELLAERRLALITATVTGEIDIASSRAVAVR